MMAACNEQGLWNYCGVSENCGLIDSGEYHTYGIRVEGPNFSETVHDVSSNQDVIDRMTHLFNKHQLSPIHFRDAVNDLLDFLE